MTTQTIKHRFSGKTLFEIEAGSLRIAIECAVKEKANLSGAYLSGAYLSGAYLSGADLSGAHLSGAHLFGANLSGADLSGAYLFGANLSGANLSGANLSGAHLSGANLSGAYGVSPYLCTPLLMLLDQPGFIRAYKLVTDKMTGNYYPKLDYSLGNEVSVDDADTDVSGHCSAGVNVATLDWCIKEWRTSYRIMVVEFTAADIAAIPTATDGKFRLHRCKVVGEKDLKEIGLIKSDEEQ